MDIQTRLHESEQKYETLQTERTKHLQAADECMTEMTKLQGEWRVLNELLEKDSKKKVNKKANVIEAVPDTQGEAA